jgi:hypothetical protein
MYEIRFGVNDFLLTVPIKNGAMAQLIRGELHPEH